MKFVVKPVVNDILEELVTVLYQQKYFSYEETAKEYVNGLLDDIYLNLPIKQKKPAPKYFERYGKGMYYAVFRRNKHTSWYVFFRMYQENEELTYQIRYITNNHVDAHHF